MLKTMSAISVLLFAAVGPQPEHPGQPAAPLQTRFWLEQNPGQEVVLKIAAESEDELIGLQIIGPDGRKLTQCDARGGGATGLSSLELEFREFSLPGLLSTWIPGTYALRAVTIDGALATGMAHFEAELPSATNILEPQSGALVSPSDLTVRWTPESQASGYEVRIDQDDEEGLVIKLPPQQHSLQLPAGCLAPEKETVVEVAVIGANGNCTLTEVQFTTLPQ
jgi:hypothetical protein